MKCELCDCQLVEKNDKPYGKKGSECHISRHHYFPKRFNRFFTSKEIKEIFGIKNKEEKVNLCYDCHEVLIHNTVFNPIILEKLKNKMRGRAIKERIVALHKQLLK